MQRSRMSLNRHIQEDSQAVLMGVIRSWCFTSLCVLRQGKALLEESRVKLHGTAITPDHDTETAQWMQGHHPDHGHGRTTPSHDRARGGTYALVTPLPSSGCLQSLQSCAAVVGMLPAELLQRCRGAHPAGATLAGHVPASRSTTSCILQQHLAGKPAD